MEPGETDRTAHLSRSTAAHPPVLCRPRVAACPSTG